MPVCNPDPDGRPLGLPLGGRSDSAGMLAAAESGIFELACTAGPQAKCVRFGYGPWRQAPDGRPMIEWFNACVRMMRGDYCGNGQPYTRDGTWIDLYDRIGVQTSDDDPTLKFEAVWGPEGAICVARPRLPDIITLDGLARACPRLAGRLGPAACNENAPGGLIINRSR
jgi:ADYC domain